MRTFKSFPFSMSSTQYKKIYIIQIFIVKDMQIMEEWGN